MNNGKKEIKKERSSLNQCIVTGLRLLRYEVSDEPIPDQQYSRLPDEVKDTIERLYKTAQRQPRLAIPELEALIKEYPQLPMLYNYLSVAYLGVRDQAKAKEIILQNYTQNPDYLFARINYAELYLVAGDYAKVAEIFDHKFDLQLLYPKRKRFHISEYFGFMGIIGPYFLATGERELAVNVYKMMQNINPSHSTTRRLRRQLYPGPLRRLLKWLTGKR